MACKSMTNLTWGDYMTFASTPGQWSSYGNAGHGYSMNSSCTQTVGDAATSAQRKLTQDEYELTTLSRMQYQLSYPAPWAASHTTATDTVYIIHVAHFFTPYDTNGLLIATNKSILTVSNYFARGNGGTIILTPPNGVTIEPPTNNGTISPAIINIHLDADVNRDGNVNTNDAAGKNIWSIKRGAFALPREASISSTSQLSKLCKIIARPPSVPSYSGVSVQLWREGGDGTEINIELLGTNGVAIPSVGGVQNHFDITNWPGNDLVFRVCSDPSRLENGEWPDEATLQYRLVRNSDGANLLTDRVRVKVAPFILPPECNAPETIYTTRLMTNVPGLIYLNTSLTDTNFEGKKRWTQDEVKFCKTECMSGNVADVAVDLSHTGGGNLLAVITTNAGIPGCSTWNVAGEGGNMMATPPLPDAPYGKILLGTGHFESLSYWTNQALQPVVQLDTSWLYVGHVDEAIMWANSNVVLYADPWKAADLIHQEMTNNYSTNTMWCGMESEAGKIKSFFRVAVATNAAFGVYKYDHLVSPPLDATTNSTTFVANYGWFENGDVIRVDDELLRVTAVDGSTVTVARAIGGRPSMSHSTGAVMYAYSQLMCANLPVAAPGQSAVDYIVVVSNQLRSSLGSYATTFVPVPVLFEIAASRYDDNNTFRSIPHPAQKKCWIDGVALPHGRDE